MQSFLICFICCFIGYATATIICWFTWRPHHCDGEIVMHGDELYLAITEEDKEALETKKFATLRLVREKFNGFSE